MNGIGFIFKTSTIPFSPDWPPNTRRNQFPPSFLSLAASLLIQQLRRSEVCSGMDQLWPEMFRKSSRSWEVYLQCKNRWLFVSPVKLHKKHLGISGIPFYCNTSWVRHALLVISQVKHFTLVGINPFHMLFSVIFDLGRYQFKHPSHVDTVNCVNALFGVTPGNSIRNLCRTMNSIQHFL